MDNSFGVRRIERVGDFEGNRQPALDFQGPTLDQMLEGGTVEILHGDEGLAFMLSNLVNRANIGMVQSRSGPGFPTEPLQRVGVGNHFLRKKFEGNEAAQFEV